MEKNKPNNTERHIILMRGRGEKRGVVRLILPTLCDNVTDEQNTQEN
jgi:hypothetical protein